MLEFDTAQLDKCISDFESCIYTYNEKVYSFFKEINNFEGWSGDAAQKFKEKAAIEKEKYVKYGESLYKFSETLSSVLLQATNTAISSAKD